MFSNFFSAFPEPDVLKSIQNYRYFMKSIVDVASEKTVNSDLILFLWSRSCMPDDATNGSKSWMEFDTSTTTLSWMSESWYWFRCDCDCRVMRKKFRTYRDLVFKFKNDAWFRSTYLSNWVMNTLVLFTI